MILSRNNKNQEHVISEISKAMKSLILVVEKENQSLRLGKISQIKNIIEEKIAALQNLNDAQNIAEEFFHKNGTFKPTTSMDKLKKLFSDLTVVNQENEILIRSNLEVNNKLIEMFKESKTDQVISNFGYNKDGRTIAQRVEHVMPSISLNSKV